MCHLIKKFQMQPHEMVTREKGIVFCGYEIDQEQNGDYVLSQSKCVEEMLRRRQIRRSEGQPLPKIRDDDEETGVTTKELRAAAN